MKMITVSKFYSGTGVACKTNYPAIVVSLREKQLDFGNCVPVLIDTARKENSKKKKKKDLFIVKENKKFWLLYKNFPFFDQNLFILNSALISNRHFLKTFYRLDCDSDTFKPSPLFSPFYYISLSGVFSIKMLIIDMRILMICVGFLQCSHLWAWVTSNYSPYIGLKSEL